MLRRSREADEVGGAGGEGVGGMLVGGAQRCAGGQTCFRCCFRRGILEDFIRGARKPAADSMCTSCSAPYPPQRTPPVSLAPNTFKADCFPSVPGAISFSACRKERKMSPRVSELHVLSVKI